MGRAADPRLERARLDRRAAADRREDRAADRREAARGDRRRFDLGEPVQAARRRRRAGARTGAHDPLREPAISTPISISPPAPPSCSGSTLEVAPRDGDRGGDRRRHQPAPAHPRPLQERRALRHGGAHRAGARGRARRRSGTSATAPARCRSTSTATAPSSRSAAATNISTAAPARRPSSTSPSSCRSG